MTTIFNAPLRSIDDRKIRQLRTRYPEARLRLEIEQIEPLGEAEFWSVVGQLDWGRKGNEDIAAPAIAALAQFSETDIERFDDLLAAKLFALDGERFAAGLLKNGGFSTDVFLYARCCAVANGPDFYAKTLNDPSFFPVGRTFEPLLYVAEKAHRLKTGRDDYDHLTAIHYETFSNQAGWPGRSSLQELLEGA